MNDDNGWAFDRSEINRAIEQACSLTTAAFTGAQNMLDSTVVISCERIREQRMVMIWARLRYFGLILYR